jgi:hypothetical protein
MMQPSLLNRLIRKLDKTLASAFFIDQWVILTTRHADFRNLRWEDFVALMPEKDRYWGDPFPIRREGRTFVFVEEKMYATGRGHIACLELDADGGLASQQTVLQRDYHLSYPFLFERGQDLYMIPESAANRTVELYRCARFPDKWEFVKVLLRDVYAVDATVLEDGGGAWLFANVKQSGGSSLNALHLFRAESPLADDWRPHPQNPVVRGIGSARPAGRIFTQDGQLIRPSQDSSRRYGGALKFNRITTLDENGYSEECVAGFEPRGGPIRATHTFNQIDGTTVIDAVIRRPKR